MMENLLDQLTGPSVTSAAPTRADQRRNDWVLALCIAVLLALGWGVRMLALDNSRTISLGEGLPEITYPGTWAVDSAAAPLLFSARNGASRTTFDAILNVSGLPVRPQETLDTVRSSLALRRSQELDRYRELAAEPVVVLGDRPALLTTYAYIADPTRESGANGLPVVVQAQDLLFLANTQWLVVTTAADAAAWEAELPAFEVVTDALGLQPRPAPDAATEGTTP